MCKKIVSFFIAWYGKGRRVWLPAVLGLFFACAFPPFSRQTHPLFALFPLTGFIILVPLFCFSMQRSLKKALLDSYIYGAAACFSQYYWVAGVAAEGLRHIIILGSFAMSLFLALYYLAPALVFRMTCRFFKRAYVFIYPSAWILIEFFRGWGELSFPWNYLGYGIASFLPLAQAASVCGIFGLSFIAVVGNILVWELLRSCHLASDIMQKWLHLVIYGACLIGIAIWGWMRMSQPIPQEPSAVVSMIQSNMDQAHWGDGSLDTCLDITERMAYCAAADSPDVIILAESALFCYLARQPDVYNRVTGWVDSAKSPIITGSLHWKRIHQAAQKKNDYAVYNTAFFIDTGAADFETYFKIRLLPFSEVMPFEAQLPILNRLNLGEADFSRGTEEKIFHIGSKIRAAPFICFEIVFPDLVRRRVRAGANLLVNITNDGWWGRSNGPFHHAAMARLRCIENGAAMARCANSGVSMAVDQYGRALKSAGLGTRTVLSARLPLTVVPTLYTRWGDWPLCAALFICCGAGLFITASFAARKFRYRKAY